MQTVRYRPEYSLRTCTLCAALCGLFVLYAHRVLAHFSPVMLIPFLLLALIALVTLWILVEQLVRAVSPIGCFRITPDGLEHLPVGFRLLGIRLPGAVRCLPWSCIQDIRLERANAHTVLRIQTVDDADFPKGYSRYVRMLLEREAQHDSYGFAIDWSHIDGDPEAWAHKLQTMLAEYRSNRPLG